MRVWVVGAIGGLVGGGEWLSLELMGGFRAADCQVNRGDADLKFGDCGLRSWGGYEVRIGGRYADFGFACD